MGNIIVILTEMDNIESKSVTLNRSVLNAYLLILMAGLIIMLGYLLYQGKYRPALAMLVPIGYLIAITQPRLAVYQFILIMFTNIAVLYNPAVLLIDLSAFLLISAGLFDYLLRPQEKAFSPKFLINFIFIIAVLMIAGLMGYNPQLAIRPILKMIYLVAAFLAMYRLSRYFSINSLLKIFYWFAVIHAAIALAPYIGGAASERIFGLAHATLDDIMMMALPMGIILFLHCRKKQGLYYLLGMILLLAALIATQSRLSLMLGLLFSAVAFYLSNRRVNKFYKELHADRMLLTLRQVIKKRIRMIGLFFIGMIAILMAVKPEMFLALWERFEGLVMMVRWDTIQIRFVLWQAALEAFWDHPLLGIGPGQFKMLNQIYPELHFNYVFLMVRGFSAHNLILHYLAETGLLGASAVIMLMVNLFRWAKKMYVKFDAPGKSETLLILYIVSFIFLVTSFVEAGWLWGQMSYFLIFFAALISQKIAREKIEK